MSMTAYLRGELMVDALRLLDGEALAVIADGLEPHDLALLSPEWQQLAAEIESAAQIAAQPRE
jgi:hypothetical protein